MNLGKFVYLFCVTLLIFSFCRCSSDNNVHGFTYNFENLADKPINVVIYKTLSDYYNGTNVYMTGRMKLREYFTVPIDKFTTGQTYYVDWYSDDLLYTNWYWSNITLRTAFNPSDYNSEYLVNTVEFSDPSRTIWMNGLGVQTTWKAVDAYTQSGSAYTSVWGQLSATRQNVKVILNKDFSAHLMLQDASYQLIDSPLTYRPNYDLTNHLSVCTLYDASNSAIGTLTSNFSPQSLNFTGPDNTMLANINGLGYYQMSRQ